MFPFFKYLEKTWKGLLSERKYKEHKKMEKEIENLLQGLDKIKANRVWLNKKAYSIVLFY